MRAPAVIALALAASLGAGTAALAADGSSSSSGGGRTDAPGQNKPKTSTGDAVTTETTTTAAGEEPKKEPATATDHLAPAAPPVLGESASVAAASGEVRVKLPGSDEYMALGEAASVPMGSTLDASQGAVRLTSAADDAGATQTATFHDGAFTLRQASSAGTPVTELQLTGGDFSACAKPARAARAAAPPRRELWGSGHGRFRTRGRNSAATVRGTIWLTRDTCEGTLTVVRRGVVAVYDRVENKTVMVRAGHRYLAKAPATSVLVGTFKQLF